MTDETTIYSRLGRFVGPPPAGIPYAFVPPRLPSEPPIDVMRLLDKLSLAEHALGQLDGITMLFPRQELFLYMYVRKEASRSVIADRRHPVHPLLISTLRD